MITQTTYPKRWTSEENADGTQTQNETGLFRAIHLNEVATNMADYISSHPNMSSARRHVQKYLIPHCNTDVHKKSLFISTAKLWNNHVCNFSLLVGPPVAGERFQLMVKHWFMLMKWTKYQSTRLTLRWNQGVIKEGGCTLIPFVDNTMAHNYCYHRLAYGN